MNQYHNIYIYIYSTAVSSQLWINALFGSKICFNYPYQNKKCIFLIILIKLYAEHPFFRFKLKNMLHDNRICAFTGVMN